MTVTQTFFLLMWAIIGLCLVVFSPSRRFMKGEGGNADTEVTALLQPKDAQGIMLEGCLWAGLLLEFIQTIVVEPAYFLWGLLTHVGQKEFAYGALAGLLLNVLLSIVDYLVSKARHQRYPQITWFTWLVTCIAALPTLYLWYLFCVLVGLAH